MGTQRRGRAVAPQQARAAPDAGAAFGRRRLVPGPLARCGGHGRPGANGGGMELTLERIEQQFGPQTWLYPLDLTLVPRAVTVLLGATQSGKTTLMRVMAGLDAPSKGRVLADGRDVTGLPVRE